MEISVIIVTHNNGQTIKKCLDSIKEQVEIIVVDNNSADETTNLVKKYKNVVLFESDTNLGFAKANNLGVKHCSGQYLIFLNPDTRIKQDLCSTLSSLLKENPEYGLIGPKLIMDDSRIQKSARKLPTIFNAFSEYILGIQESHGFYEPNCQELCEVESVVGACMVIKKDFFQSLGGFDEKYFLYYEDLELCRSVRAKGLKVGYYPKVFAYHKVGSSGYGHNTSKYNLESSLKYHGFFVFNILQIIYKIGGKLGRVS